MEELIHAVLKDQPVRMQIADNLPEGIPAQYIPKQRTVYVRNGMEANTTFHAVNRELACAALDQHDGNYMRKKVNAQAYCAAYVVGKRYGADVSGFQFGKVAEMQANGQKDSQELRGFLMMCGRQPIPSATIWNGTSGNRNRLLLRMIFPLRNRQSRH